jgi:hypothetical protein
MIYRVGTVRGVLRMLDDFQLVVRSLEQCAMKGEPSLFYRNFQSVTNKANLKTLYLDQYYFRGKILEVDGEQLC